MISIEITAKKEKYYFRKISAGNNFGQLRISDGLIFGQKKIRNLSPRNFWVLETCLFNREGQKKMSLHNFFKRTEKLKETVRISSAQANLTEVEETRVNERITDAVNTQKTNG